MASDRSPPARSAGRSSAPARRGRLLCPVGTLIVGTDGLFKYAPAWRIAQVASSNHPDAAARSLVDLVRMPNGKWQDDVGLVVCRLEGPGTVPDA